MKRVDFMNQLESLLQSIPSTEREEAIQYYNDYFDDAGAENEQEVIEALGNPARVAENIKRDLAGNGYGEASAQKVKASDRVLMEYGKKTSDGGQETAGASGQGAAAGTFESQDSAGYGAAGRNGREQSGGSAREDFQGYGRDGHRNTEGSPFGGNGESSRYNAGENGSGTWSDASHYSGYTSEKPAKKDGMPVWAIALLVTLLLFASPVLAGAALGILGIVFGGIVGWFALIFGIGVSSAVLLLIMVVLILTGIICVFASPWVGMALVGGGLICGCIGLLLLMLTVAMAGIITPAVFRGIAFVFRGFRRKKAMAN